MSVSAKPVKAGQVNIDSVKFSEVKTGKSGNKNVYINNDDRSRIFIQTPELEIPFDSGNFWPNEKHPGSGKYDVRVQLKGWNVEGSPAKDLYDMLTAFDERIKAEAKKESLAWLKKKQVTEEIISEKYTSMVNFKINDETGEPDDRFPPTFKFKIPQYDGTVECVCFQHGSKEPMNVNDPEKENYVKLGIHCPYGSKIKHEGVFKKGTKVKMVLRCNGIWMSSAGFGCTWSAQQIRIKANPTFDNYSFLDDTDEEVDATETTEKLDTEFVESSDEEEDQ